VKSGSLPDLSPTPRTIFLNFTKYTHTNTKTHILKHTHTLTQIHTDTQTSSQVFWLSFQTFVIAFNIDGVLTTQLAGSVLLKTLQHLVEVQLQSITLSIQCCLVLMWFHANDKYLLYYNCSIYSQYTIVLIYYSANLSNVLTATKHD
jgi:hypothetical protein